MAAPSYSLPTIGQDNSTEDPKVRTALSDLKTLLTDGIDDSNISTGGVGSGSLASGAALANLASASLTDAKLASPNNSVYKTINSTQMQGSSNVTISTGNKLYVNESFQATQSGTSGAVGNCTPTPLFHFVASDYAVAGLTTKLRVRMQVSTGSHAPGSTVVTGGLYPVSISSGNWTLGTVVSGTTAASSGLATNTISGFASSDATIPADGIYCLGFIFSTATFACTGGVISLQLQTRNV